MLIFSGYFFCKYQREKAWEDCSKNSHNPDPSITNALNLHVYYKWRAYCMEYVAWRNVLAQIYGQLNSKNKCIAETSKILVNNSLFMFLYNKKSTELSFISIYVICTSGRILFNKNCDILLYFFLSFTLYYTLLYYTILYCCLKCHLFKHGYFQSLKRGDFENQWGALRMKVPEWSSIWWSILQYVE